MSARWTVCSYTELVRRIKANTDEELWMRHVALDESQIALIADCLLGASTITELWLCSCDITDIGVAEIARVLKDPNCTLRSINLSGNVISNDGAIELFTALEKNTSLHCLLLNENLIGDAGAFALARLLNINTTLREVYLWDNQIRDRGCSAIAAAVKLNKTITKCELDNGDSDETNLIFNKEVLRGIVSQCAKNKAQAQEDIHQDHNFRVRPRGLVNTKDLVKV